MGKTVWEVPLQGITGCRGRRSEAQPPSFGTRGLPKRGDIKAPVCQRPEGEHCKGPSWPRGQHGARPKEGQRGLSGPVCREAAGARS